jgi:hypothetical protein
LIHIIRRLQVASAQARAVKNYKTCTARMLAAGNNIQQAGQLYRNPQLFGAFAKDCAGRIFPRVHIPARYRPQAALWHHRPAHQQEPPVLFDPSRSGYFGIKEVHMIAGWAARTECPLPLLAQQRRPAERTKANRRVVARCLGHPSSLNAAPGQQPGAR